MVKEHQRERLRGPAILLFLVLVIFETFTNAVAETNYTAVVETTSGPVRGEIARTHTSKEYAVFKGIRYGQAPIGYLRFKPPLPAKRQNETLLAVVEAPQCAQFDLFIHKFKGSEDCLFLNVFTPITKLETKPKKLIAVMVWVYGGGFSTGGASGYQPNYLIDRDVIYVSMNFRGGALGYLNLGHPNATGNQGLKDQVLAFKWVQANIENFGGDPKNITIFGHSSGGASIGYHVISDATKGLFHGAISMSAEPISEWALQSTRKAFPTAVKLGVLLGVNSYDRETLLDTFYRATAKELALATHKISDAIPPFAPTIEDPSIATDIYLTSCAVDRYATGNYNQVPQMLGFLRDEALLFFKTRTTLMETVNYSIDYSRRIGMPVAPVLLELKRRIESGTTIAQLSRSIIDAGVKVLSASMYTAMIDEAQRRFAATSSAPIYYYYVTYVHEVAYHNIFFNMTLTGAAHADDVMYLYYYPFYGTDPKSCLARTIDRYTTMWTNFAKYGNPTPHWVKQPNINIEWPDSRRSGAAINIGKELSIISRPVDSEIKKMQHYTRPVLRKLMECENRCVQPTKKIVEHERKVALSVLHFN